MLDLSKKYMANTDYLLRTIADEAVLIPVGENSDHSNLMFSLNSSCTFLWQVFQEPCSVQEAVEAASREFDAAEDELRISIIAFVRDYCEHGLLREVN